MDTTTTPTTQATSPPPLEAVPTTAAAVTQPAAAAGQDKPAKKRGNKAAGGKGGAAAKEKPKRKTFRSGKAMMEDAAESFTRPFCKRLAVRAVPGNMRITPRLNKDVVKIVREATYQFVDELTRGACLHSYQDKRRTIYEKDLAETASILHQGSSLLAKYNAKYPAGADRQEHARALIDHRIGITTA